MFGALCSGVLVGFIGMYSVQRSRESAVAAKEKGASEALNIAFFGGSIMD